MRRPAAARSADRASRCRRDHARVVPNRRRYSCAIANRYRRANASSNRHSCANIHAPAISNRRRAHFAR